MSDVQAWPRSVEQLFARAQARAERELKHEHDGLHAGRLLSACIDKIVEVLALEVPVGNEGVALAVFAVGGYGRQVMAPHSDVDLTFVHCGDGASNATLTERIVYGLWDLGCTVNHTMRTVEESLALAIGDHTICTALLDRRFLLGDKDLATRFDEALTGAYVGRAREFIAAKLAERDARHRRHGYSRYLVEPDVKNGKGGLRDLQTLYWMAKHARGGVTLDEVLANGVFTTKEARSFRAHARFLWAVRYHMHLLAGRAKEKLTFDLQPELAERMGYRATRKQNAVERFMKRYFLAARDAGALTRILCARLEQQERERHFSEGVRSDPVADIEGPFCVLDGRLSVCKSTLGGGDALDLLRLFWVAGARRLDIHPDAMAWARRESARVSRLRGDPRASDLFLTILSGQGHPGTILRLMHESGVLGALIPEFRRIVGQTQFNMYHHYTVDEHTLIAIETIADMDCGLLGKEFPEQSVVLERIDNRRALYLAMLLHDVGKGSGDQQIEGARLGRVAALRLGLPADEADLVSWLIGHHLLMSDRAQRRDISDAAVVSDFARDIGSRERLDLLYVLTSADIRAVGPGTWNAWKARLLRNLYVACARVLDASGDSEISSSSVSDRSPDSDALRGIEQSYWLRHNDTERARHLRTIHAAADGYAVSAHAHPHRSGTRLTVSAPDRMGLFADIAALLVRRGCNLVAARLYGLGEGRVLDLLDIQASTGSALLDSDAARLASDIETGLEAGVAAPAPPKPSRRQAAFIVEPDILLRRGSEADTAMVTVSARNHPSVIYELAQALTGFGFSILSAHVDLHGARVHTAFYVKELGPAPAGGSREAELMKALRRAATRPENSISDADTGLRRAPASTDQ